MAPANQFICLLPVLAGLGCAGSTGPRSANSAFKTAQTHVVSSTGVASPEVLALLPVAQASVSLTVHMDRERQTILGIGGSLTQASAAALGRLSSAQRTAVLEAYFGPEGAGYSLTRTHIGSSDFSEYSYSYVPNKDPKLESFSVQEDEKNGLINLILDARRVSGARFEIIASPWTAPAWMKEGGKLYDPKKGRGGRLLVAHYDTFARYLVKYLRAYAQRGLDIWAITPVNEPQGNAGTWESMEMTPEEQRDFLRVLGPRLREAKLDPRILIFDQNRAEMGAYTEVLFNDAVTGPLTYGTAVHWYNSTYKVYEDILEEQHRLYPDKVIVHSEGTIDSVAGEASCHQTCPNPPCGCEQLYAWWKDDAWYWEKKATDWGWDWAQNREVDHPKYAPAHRYARDLVVGLGHWLAGWVDWNIVLDKRGGPNHVNNYCLAPVMVDGESDTVYYTPLFSIMKQVSRHTRPGAVVLETTLNGPKGFYATAVRNPDGSVAVHVFNESGAEVSYALELTDESLAPVRTAVVSPHASLQTVVFK